MAISEKMVKYPISKKNCNCDKKIVKTTIMIVISTDAVVVCIGTNRDCQCHRYLLL